MATKIQYPSSYDPQDAFKDYTPRVQEFMALGAQAGLRPASQDVETGAMVIVDMQNDFVRPAGVGALPVPGAEEDVQRTIEFIYRNAEKITTIYATLDSHYPLQIFYREWWENPVTREHPDDYTEVTYADIMASKLRARIDPKWSHFYVPELERLGRHKLMLWPKHTMIGTWGHNIVPALFEAIMWHSAARRTLPIYLIKGDVPQVERYGAFGPEVAYDLSDRGHTDTDTLDLIAKHRRTWWVAEAQTHCGLESKRQAVEYFADKHPQVLSNMFFLTDCTSPIIHPTIDFLTPTLAEEKRMASRGVQFVKSTDHVK